MPHGLAIEWFTGSESIGLFVAVLLPFILQGVQMNRKYRRWAALALGSGLVLGNPIPAQAEGTSSVSSLSATFHTETANPWRLSVVVSGSQSIVQVKGCVDGQCFPLQRQSGGSWSAGTPFPVVGPVAFVASNAAGENATSEIRAWPSGKIWEDENTESAHGVSSPSLASEDFQARFHSPVGGKWWVEVEIFANQNVRRVEVVSDSTELTSWHTKPLFASHKGTWSSSFLIPQGTKVHFRAQGSAGAWVSSEQYLWPDAVPIGNLVPDDLAEAEPSEEGEQEDPGEETFGEELANEAGVDPLDEETPQPEIAAEGNGENLAENEPPETNEPVDLRSSLSSLVGKKSPEVVERHTGLSLSPHFVVDRDAAIVLGKALFWDQQVGSDGVACASCHFQAGADARIKNQLSPGLIGGNGVFDPLSTGGGGPNYALRQSDFPLRTDDVVSSSGVVAQSFHGIMEGYSDFENKIAPDLCEALLDEDPLGFHQWGVNLRRAAPRNSPSAILATFNFTNFWDGRARREFNGATPFGKRDASASIREVNASGEVKESFVLFENLSAASQSVGPPLSPMEMSCAGRRFLQLGKKLLSLMPLQLQNVSFSDGVFGPYVDASGLGLSVTYADLIAKAFHPRFWDSDAVLDEAGNTLRYGIPEADDEYDLMAINFAFLWGLAIHMYEDTLVPDQSPFDRYMDGDDGALSASELAGLRVFQGKGKCINCHKTATLSSASTLHLVPELREGGVVERMRMSGQKYDYGLRGEFETHSTGTKRKITIDSEANIRALGIPSAPGEAVGTVRIESEADCAYHVTSWILDPDQNSGSWSSTKDVELHAALETGEPIGCADTVRVSWSVPPGSPTGRLRVYENDKTFAKIDVSASIKSYRWLTPVLYDNGFYNIGVRPVQEDIGVGGEDPFGNPLSYTKQYLGMLMGKKPSDPFEIDECKFAIPYAPDVDKFFFPGGFTAVDCLDGTTAYRPKKPSEIKSWPLRHAQKKAIQRVQTGVNGAFKTPMLRNVELTGPYFHTGGYATLEQVVDFYDRGGDFPRQDGIRLDADIRPLELTSQEKSDLVAFMKALTDQRVVRQQAPFDHPELFVPHGHMDRPTADAAAKPLGADEFLELPATGKEGWFEENEQCFVSFEANLQP